MSSRYWNTSLERKRLQDMVYLTAILLQDTENKSEDESSSSSDDLQHAALQATLNYQAYIQSSNESPRITFGQRLRIDDFDEATCLSNFRFRQHDLRRLADLLWPRLQMSLQGPRDSVLVKYRYRIPFDTGFLIVLYRFSRPHNIHDDMESFFGMRKSHLSAVVATFVDALYDLAYTFFNDPAIYKARMPVYADLIKRKIGVIDSVWGFIDGTLRKTCRPTYHQRMLYSGHKRQHGIKFQSVVTPDGLIALLFGPIEGSRHDSYMLGESGLLPQLRALMPADGSLGPVYSLFGDPAYPQSLHIFGGFRHTIPGTVEARWNTLMSQVRQVVEWGFKEIVAQWAFVDHRPRMRIFKSPVGKYYVVATFLTNLRNCCYGGQIATYFETTPLSIEDYLSLVDANNDD